MGLGLWWLVLPLLAVAAWLYLGDGRMRRSRLPLRPSSRTRADG